MKGRDNFTFLLWRSKKRVQDDGCAYNRVRSRALVTFLNISARFSCVSHDMSLNKGSCILVILFTKSQRLQNREQEKPLRYGDKVSVTRGMTGTEHRHGSHDLVSVAQLRPYDKFIAQKKCNR
jgi:hypothetical protein